MLIEVKEIKETQLYKLNLIERFYLNKLCSCFSI
jgi:hypothetical protein